MEAATNLFAEIQSAYEVLSDPQERSWYDSHRDTFLRADDGGEASDYSYNARMTTSTDIVKLFSKFSPRMEFSDSPSGFYGGLRDIFAQLASEEDTACRWEGVNAFRYPSFGSHHDPLHVAREFYSVWGSFSTTKSFAWKDVYRYSEAPDRRVRRMMEKENRRLREGAIREFNEAVRSLVAFAKKRDPRYKAYKDSQSQSRVALQRSAASQASRSRAANQANFRDHVLQDWAKPEDSGHFIPESSDEGEAEHFECIVCHKTFKSLNQFQAHERSKKHIKATKQLRWEMRMQHDELDLGLEVVQPTEDRPHDSSFDPSSPVSVDWNEEGETNRLKININPSTASKFGHNLQGDSSDFKPNHSRQSESNAEHASNELLEHRLVHDDSFTQSSVHQYDDLSHKLSASGLNDNVLPPSIKVGKAKQKHAKKAQLAAVESQTNCTICNASFASRNKLFSHIKTHEGR